MSTTHAALLSRSPEQTSSAAAPSSPGTVRVTLTDETERKLAVKAAETGATVRNVVEQMLSRHLDFAQVEGSSNIVIVFGTSVNRDLNHAMRQHDVTDPQKLVEQLFKSELAQIPDRASATPAFI